MSIRVEDLGYVYMPGTPLEAVALQEVNLDIRDGEFVGLIGQTGSGKSTLVQHFNGLLRPTRGRVLVDGEDLSRRETSIKEIRRRVGLVFQYPEHQLFEETVFADVAFGPRRLGLTGEELESRVEAALEGVGLDAAALGQRSPFELSGGQMRRVAMAGVLAMQPRVLILDEPTAGLDPRGRDEILAQVQVMHRDYGLTVVLVSHSMEDVARLAHRLLVMHRGQLVLGGSAREVFRQAQRLQDLGLDVPQITQVMRGVRDACCPELPVDVLTVQEGREALRQYLDPTRRDAHA